MDPAIEDWIAAVQAGDMESYQHVVRAFQQPIFIYCYRLLGNEHEAEDAAQEVLVRAYTSIAQYKPAVSYSSWLYRIAHNYCMNILRRKRLSLKFQWLTRRDEITESPEQLYERNIFSEPMEAAIKSLSLEEKSLLILHVFEERSYVEISEIVGKSHEAVKKRLGRIKEKVRRQILKHEGEARWNDNKIVKTEI